MADTRAIAAEATNVRALVRLAKKDPAIHSLFAHIAEQSEAPKESEVDETASALGLGRAQVVQIFRQLDQLKLGRFVVGRRGGVSRFQWWVDPIDVRANTLGARPVLSPIEWPESDDGDGADEEEGSAEETPETQVNAENVLNHSYKLRADFTIKLILPASLSKNEAERLAAFIRTLPFE